MKTIARAFVPLLLIVVGGCANWGSTAGLTEAEQEQLTPLMRVYAAKADLHALLDQVVAYAEQPACSDTVVVACADPDVVHTARLLAHRTRTLLDQAEALACPGRVGLPPEEAAAVACEAAPGAGAQVDVARAALKELSAWLVAKSIAEGATP